MYGMVNQAIEDLVRTQHGDETWDRIRHKAQVEDDTFVSLQTYPDQVTYALVAAASEELGVPAGPLLEAFGEYWVMYTGREGYGHLFTSYGNSLESFLTGLDAMHARIAVTMPELRPPSFACRSAENGDLEVDYTSSREGLAPMVVGLIRGLGQVFETPVEVTHADHLGKGRERFHVRRLAP